MSVGFEGFRAVVLADSPDRARRLAAALEDVEGGADALTATTVDEAVQRLAEGNADCVVAGRYVAGADAERTAERLAARADGQPVVVETTVDEQEAKAEALAAGADAAVGPLEDDAALSLLGNRVALAVSGRWADRTAREAHERYRRLLEASPAAIVIFDGEGVVQYANPACADLVGADDPHDLAGVPLTEYVPEEARASLEERIRTLVDEREPIDQREHPVVGSDGDRCHVEAAGSPVTIGGEPGGQVVMTDVTELKGREQRLRAERDRFTALFESLPEPAVHVEFVDEEPIVRNSNPAFEDVFGYGTEELVGESINEYVVPPEREPEAEAIDTQALSGERIEREVTRRTVDGEREFLFRAQTIDAPGGTEEGVGIYVDVTEQKQRERALERQNERLDAFASTVSHDLRSPLSVARGNLQLVREGAGDEHLDAVGDALDRMSRIIEDLLRLARGGEESTDLAVVDAQSVVAEAWASLDGTEGTLHNEWEGRVEADRSQLVALLENLLRNAVEHGSKRPRQAEDGDQPGDTSHQRGSDAGDGEASQPRQDADASRREGDPVTVEVGPLEEGFYVADDGPGIPEDRREEIFEPGHTTSDDGTGFGLVVVQEIAEAHGWAVSVTDAEDGGARFEVRGVERDP